MPHRRPEDRKHERRLLEEQLQEVQAVPPDGLTEGDQVTRRELIENIQRDLDELNSGTQEWLINHFMGPITWLLTIPEVQPMSSPEAVATYTRRLRDTPRWMSEYLDDLRRGFSKGQVSPLAPLERALIQMDKLLMRPARDWTLHEHYQLAPESCRAREAHQGLDILQNELLPLLNEYRNMLRHEFLPHARSHAEPGMCHIPGGAEGYARLIRVHTSLSLSAEEIHAIGIKKVARLREQIRELGSRLFGTQDIPEIQRHLLEDEDLRFDSAEEILSSARSTVELAEGALESFFGLRPEAHCEVREIPEHEAPDAALAFYQRPSPGGDRPGALFVNTFRPHTRTRYESEVLVFHEAVPGHHLQIDIASRLNDLPAFRRHGGVTAYFEGWALYSEKLGEEMGLYSGDLTRIGARSFDTWRACRLVVDTGLHAFGWSREKAIEYMSANTLLSEENILNEVDRYLVLPGQALSYKLGERELLRLRKFAEEQMGENFALSDFHDRVLEMGAVSLGTLGDRIEGWARGEQELDKHA
jgi:uncharacterized protein (DUF885 family)